MLLHFTLAKRDRKQCYSLFLAHLTLESHNSRLHQAEPEWAKPKAYLLNFPSAEIKIVGKLLAAIKDLNKGFDKVPSK